MPLLQTLSFDWGLEVLLVVELAVQVCLGRASVKKEKYI